MHVNAEMRRELPALSWCAELREGRDRVDLLHGPSVEVSTGWIAEGAWDGDFSKGQIDSATVVLGSGLATRDDGVVFVPTSHPMERLQYMLDEDRIVVSNSLAFLLEFVGEGLDLSYPYYVRDLISFVEGRSRRVDSIPTRSARRIGLLYCDHLMVGMDLRLEIQPQQVGPAFQSYEGYLEYLRGVIHRVCSNARDPTRMNRYRPVTTISSGYDSPAASVLAREIGCREALSFRSARDVFGAGSDSGRRIGAALGLAVHEFDRNEYLSHAGFPEAEFLATGTGGEDVVTAAFEKKLERSVLFTGFLGDTVWGRHHPDPRQSASYRMKYPAGASMGEFRLRADFIHLPVPLLTFTSHPSLQRISNSSGMRAWWSADKKGWSIAAARGWRGAAYDRPIPRRLVQEAGISGEWFGQTKRAVTQPFYNREDLSEIMSSASLEDFGDFVKAHRLTTSWRTKLTGLFGEATYRFLEVVDHLLTLVGFERKSSKLRRLADCIPFRYRQRIALNDFTFFWAIAKIRSRYGAGSGPIEIDSASDTP